MDLQPFFDKSVKCDVCKYTYSTKKLRSRFVKSVRQDSDFCSYYENPIYNPLLYYVNVCPNCGYACSDKFSSHFTSNARKKIEIDICSKWSGKSYSKQRSLVDSIHTYKLGIYSGTLKNEKHINMAGLYLRLAWLYRSFTNETQEEFRFISLALEEYLQSYLHSDYQDTHLSEIKLLYLIGELSRRTNKEKQAIRYFSKVIENQKKTIEKTIVEMAREQWYEIRNNKSKLDSVN